MGIDLQLSICRSDIINMYKKVGLQPLNKRTVSGEVMYDLCVAEVQNLDRIVKQNIFQYEALRSKIDWQLPFTFLPLLPVIKNEIFAIRKQKNF